MAEAEHEQTFMSVGPFIRKNQWADPSPKFSLPQGMTTASGETQADLTKPDELMMVLAHIEERKNPMAIDRLYFADGSHHRHTNINVYPPNLANAYQLALKNGPAQFDDLVTEIVAAYPVNFRSDYRKHLYTCRAECMFMRSPQAVPLLQCQPFTSNAVCLIYLVCNSATCCTQ